MCLQQCGEPFGIGLIEAARADREENGCFRSVIHLKHTVDPCVELPSNMCLCPVIVCTHDPVSVLSGLLSLHILRAGQLKILQETADGQHAERTQRDDKSIKAGEEGN